MPLRKNIYPLPVDVAGKDETYVGRIRADESAVNRINMWIVANNRRKRRCAECCQIAEKLIEVERKKKNKLKVKS